MGDACSHRCGGDCCRSFDLDKSPVELGRARVHGGICDIVYITDMLVYQGHGVTSPVHGKESGTGKAGEPAYWYGCKHFDDDAGLCTAYESRPRMCSEYPYGQRCRYKGCGYTGGGRAESVDDLVADAIKDAMAREPIALEVIGD
jgi:Fe-S-cluster containining protein